MGEGRETEKLYRKKISRAWAQPNVQKNFVKSGWTEPGSDYISLGQGLGFKNQSQSGDKTIDAKTWCWPGSNTTSCRAHCQF